MVPIKVYLDTSVINFLYAEDAPEKKEVTLEFFNVYHEFNDKVQRSD